MLDVGVPVHIPALFRFSAIAVQFAGAIALILDLFTRLAALGIALPSGRVETRILLFDFTLLDRFVEYINIPFRCSSQFLKKKFAESIFHLPADCRFVDRPINILMLIECHIP